MSPPDTWAKELVFQLKTKDEPKEYWHVIGKTWTSLLKWVKKKISHRGRPASAGRLTLSWENKIQRKIIIDIINDDRSWGFFIAKIRNAGCTYVEITVRYSFGKNN